MPIARDSLDIGYRTYQILLKNQSFNSSSDARIDAIRALLPLCHTLFSHAHACNIASSEHLNPRRRFYHYFVAASADLLHANFGTNPHFRPSAEPAMIPQRQLCYTCYYRLIYIITCQIHVGYAMPSLEPNCSKDTFQKQL